MSQPSTSSTASTAVMYCYKHPKVETLVRCGRCDRPICVKCMVRHPVGMRCKECAQIRKDPLTTLTPTQYVLAFLSALAGGTVGGFIAPFLGILFAFFIAPVIGGGIAEFVGRVVGYKRGLVMQLIVGVCIVLGIVIAQTITFLVQRRGLPSVETWLAAVIASLIGSILYIIFAIGGAIARLR